jgi:hypothetical protein
LITKTGDITKIVNQQPKQKNQVQATVLTLFGLIPRINMTNSTRFAVVANDKRNSTRRIKPTPRQVKMPLPSPPKAHPNRHVFPRFPYWLAPRLAAQFSGLEEAGLAVDSRQSG